MENKELNKLIKMFEPMSKYYSLMLLEKEENNQKKYNTQLEWLNYSNIVKKAIKKHEQEIIDYCINDESICDDEDLFNKSWKFLKRKEYIDYKDDSDINFWSWIKDDIKFLNYLDNLIMKINEFIKQFNEKSKKQAEEERKEQFKIFIDKYLLIAQKEQLENNYFVIDSAWLNKVIFEHGDEIPYGQISNLIQILKGKLRMPLRKIRKKLDPNIRKSIADRDNWKCKHCECDLSLPSSAWEINHIDKNPSNDDPNNLELTCRTCNKKWGG